MASTARKNPPAHLNKSNEEFTVDREAANVLLDEAVASDNPETAMRMRVVAALLYGQDVQKIRRNLSVSEAAIRSYKAQYDRLGVKGLVFRPTVLQGGLSA